MENTVSAQHTPGPWTIDHEARPAEICTVYHTSHPNGFVYVRGALGYWDASGEENMANARLIAAAPELLEALHASRIYVQDAYECAFPNESENNAVLQAIDAAIAKATGSAST